jgi:hypothetical protein
MRPKRRNIPKWVKAEVIARQAHRCAVCNVRFADGDKIEFDHRPAIIMRPINVEGTDYQPPQNDPEFIEPLHAACHLLRTVGRAPGAERTITTKGSDAHLAAKFRKLEGKNKPRKRQTIQSRGFPKMQRKFGQ